MNQVIAITVLFVMIAVKGWAQPAVTAQAYAEVIEALTAEETNQLNFGRFSPETGGGRIVLSPEGVRTAQGSVILAGGFSQPGSFTITGAPGATFTIQLPQGSAWLLHQSGNKTLEVLEWTSNPPAGSGTGVLTGGQEIVTVGATLLVGSPEDIPAGIYTGTFTLTFAYN
jgi:hypothetical protein